MARRNRIMGLACATAGLLLATSAVASGCGGSESGGDNTTDTGTPDTGVVVTDSAKPDTTPAPDTAAETVTDTAKEYDAPGSLFDVDIPDIQFDGDVSAKGCYDCTTTQCHDQVATCDKDPRCRGTLVCILTTCTSFSDTTCALGCASDYDITATDPVLGTLIGIGTCVRDKCSADCPALPGGGDAGPPPDAGSGDGTSSEASSGEIGPGGETGPMLRPPGTKVIDPVVIDVLHDLQVTLASMPEVRQGLVDHLASFTPAK
jgi:hypothetical protein